jgi:hypothetical protein
MASGRCVSHHYYLCMATAAVNCGINAWEAFADEEHMVTF